MSKPFDATTKYLVETAPADWLTYLGLPQAEVEVIDVDLSTVTAAADKAILVKSATPWLLHLEFQTGRDEEIGERTLQYNVLINRKYRMPVQSVVVLLRRNADQPKITGIVKHHLPVGTRYLEFRYEVVRVWQKSVEVVLEGGIGTLPLATLAEGAQKNLPEVIRRIEIRVSQELPANEKSIFWTTAYVLLGLKYKPEAIRQLLRGVKQMKESATYQEILREGRERGLEEGRERGRVAEAQHILLRLGVKRFGTPTMKVRESVEAILSIELLEALTDRLLDVESWNELLSDTISS